MLKGPPDCKPAGHLAVLGRVGHHPSGVGRDYLEEGRGHFGEGMGRLGEGRGRLGVGRGRLEVGMQLLVGGMLPLGAGMARPELLLLVQSWYILAVLVG